MAKITTSPYFRLDAVSNDRLNYDHAFENAWAFKNARGFTNTLREMRYPDVDHAELVPSGWRSDHGRPAVPKLRAIDASGAH
jgi:hypothetical protein